jgi:hypothetical protein
LSGEIPDLSGGTGGGAAAGPATGAGPAAGGGLGGGVGGGASAAGTHLLPILIAGGLSGVIAMAALIATNVLPVHSGGSGASPRGLVLVACPGSGPVLAVADPGQQFLVTGRSSDGAWLQVYLPGPALPYAWAPAAELKPSGDTSSLPIASCDIAAASPTGTPIVATATPTEIASASPTPTPTASPTNSSPIIAGLQASPATIYYAWKGVGIACGPDTQDPDTTTIGASITDAQGVASATLFYKLPGAAYVSKPMSHTGSAYGATVNVPTGFGKAGSLSYYVVSTDSSPEAKTRTSPTQTISVKKCDLPPTFSDFTTSGPNGSYIYIPSSGPAGTMPPCSVFNNTNNYIQVKGFASDPDGSVAKMVFWFTPYGGKLRSLALSPAAKFAGNLVAKYFTKLPKPGSYAFSGYLVAYDNLGHSSAHFPVGGLSFTEEACFP